MLGIVEAVMAQGMTLMLTKWSLATTDVFESMVTLIVFVTSQLLESITSLFTKVAEIFILSPTIVIVAFEVGVAPSGVLYTIVH